MTVKELLLQEIEFSSDSLLEETLKQMLEFLRQTIDRRYEIAHQFYLPLV